MRLSGILAVSSAAVLALAPIAADARNLGGGGGGHFGGGSHFSGGPRFGGGHIGRGSIGRGPGPGVTSRSARVGRSFSRAYDGGRHHGHHHHRGRYVFIAGAPYFYDDYYYSDYGGGCGWLYRRAVRTGSPYWWRRYEDCID